MKERPILFKTEMVRAILDGQKTQTRRVYKERFGVPVVCPYGLVGDRLWVRETWYEDLRYGHGYLYRADAYDDGKTVPVELRGEGGFGGGVGTVKVEKWNPSLLMPRKAARVFLKIEWVRMERLQDISEKDALEEGIETADGDRPGAARHGYRDLWESINGKGSWNANPLVWVIGFRRI